MKEFTNDEKNHLFDEIDKHFFQKNFGTTSKADLETLLFSEYIEHCIRNEECFDDYTLSKQLGITQSRVRALKERKELKYPRQNFNWRESFAKEVKNAKYDEYDHYIKLIIQDVNVMTEVRHCVEEYGWYDECSLNKKLLKIPLNCFVELCINDEDTNKLFDEETQKKVKKIKQKDSAVISFAEDFSKEGLKKFLMSASKELIADVLGLMPFGGVAKTAMDFLIKVIR